MAQHQAVSMANSQGQFQLNTYKPLMIYNLLQSLTLIADASRSFSERCIKDLQLNREVIDRNVANNLMLVTSLAPKIGYDQAAKVAHHAAEHQCSLRRAAADLNVVPEQEFDAMLDIEAMVGLKGKD